MSRQIYFLIFYSRPNWKLLYNCLSSNCKTLNFVSYWTSLQGGLSYCTAAVASSGFDAHRVVKLRSVMLLDRVHKFTYDLYLHFFFFYFHVTLQEQSSIILQQFPLFQIVYLLMFYMLNCLLGRKFFQQWNRFPKQRRDSTMSVRGDFD